MQNIIQIYPCLLKLSLKQESVTDGRTDGHYYYSPHPYRGGGGGLKIKNQHDRRYQINPTNI
jgi:hypothetical protein